MKTYTVWSHDVWGNEKDGFEVNDNFKQGSIELDPEASNQELVQRMKQEGYLAKHCQVRWLDIDGDDTYITINQARNGYPLFTLYQYEV